MNFEFSAEQMQLKGAAHQLLSDWTAQGSLRAVLSGSLSYDKELWKKLSELGFLGTAIPVEYGGAGAGVLELCAIAEELGVFLAPIPLCSSIYLAAELLLMVGTEAQKRTYLPALASGEMIACLAFAEGGGQPLQGPIRCKISGGTLSGVKEPVLDGDVADIALVVSQGAKSRDDQELTLAIVDLNGSGVQRTKLNTIDPTRGQARITFDKASLELLGPEAGGRPLVDALFNRAAILLAFEQLGGAERALGMARDYSLERIAFGRPIGSFQAIKHKLVDMYIATTLARSNAYFGAWALLVEAPELDQAAAAARISATQAFQYCARENIQIHGGMGYTWENDCHLYYRRSSLHAVSLGGLSFWEKRLIDSMQRLQKV